MSGWEQVEARSPWGGWVIWRDFVYPREVAAHWGSTDAAAHLVGEVTEDGPRLNLIRLVSMEPLTSAVTRAPFVGMFRRSADYLATPPRMREGAIPHPGNPPGPGAKPNPQAIIHRLDEVADAYREARAAGVPLWDAVANRFGIAQSYAGQLIYRARKAGLLDQDMSP
jgi:hypothetical protein